MKCLFLKGLTLSLSMAHGVVCQAAAPASISSVSFKEN